MFRLFLASAFLIRLILMPISVHTDLFFINFYPNLLYTDNVWDVFSYVEEAGLAEISYYPPLTYYTFAFFQFFYHFFSSSFSGWMHQLFNLSISEFNGQAADYIRNVPNPNIYKDLFLSKTPYFLFDIASALIILKFVKRKIYSRYLALLWLFNPVSIYSTYMVGQFDIIPAFFVLLGFILLKTNLKIGILSLGVAAAFKNYAFIFVIPTILIFGKSWKERMQLALIAVAPYLIFLIPTFLLSWKAAIYSFFPKVYLTYRKPLLGWALYSQYIKYILLFASLLLIFLFSYFGKIGDKWKFAVGISLISILFVYALAPRISFHYLIWGVPLLFLWFNKIRPVLIILIVQAISLGAYKLLANHLQLGLLAPLNPTYFPKLITFNGLVDTFFPYRFISTVGYFTFLLFNICLIFLISTHILFQMKTRE